MAKLTDKQIQHAAQALELNIPIYAARKQGRTIILLTRAGEHRYTPPAKPKPKAETSKRKPKPPVIEVKTPKPQTSEPKAKTPKPEADTSKD